MADADVFKFGWWNTHLTPPKGKSASDDDRELAVKAVSSLFANGLHALFLGEVSQDDIDFLMKKLADSTFSCSSFPKSSAGRSKFNIGVIWRPAAVGFVDSEYISVSHDDRNFKVALRLSALVQADLPVDIYVVHWTSRLLVPAETTAREIFGISLRRAIDARIASGSTNFVTLGDFNDEPYNRSMTSALKSTRDPVRAAERSGILYNPFWRKMAPKIGHLPNNEFTDPMGSFLYKSDRLQKWWMLDQILLSGSFVNGGPWFLDEAATDVWREPWIVSAVESAESDFDHLPIMGQIRRNTVGGL